MNNIIQRQTYVCKGLWLWPCLIDYSFELCKIAIGRDNLRYNVYLLERCKTLNMVMMKSFNN